MYLSQSDSFKEGPTLQVDAARSPGSEDDEGDPRRRRRGRERQGFDRTLSRAAGRGACLYIHAQYMSCEQSVQRHTHTYTSTTVDIRSLSFSHRPTSGGRLVI